MTIVKHMRDSLDITNIDAKFLSACDLADSNEIMIEIHELISSVIVLLDTGIENIHLSVLDQLGEDTSQAMINFDKKMQMIKTSLVEGDESSLLG